MAITFSACEVDAPDAKEAVASTGQALSANDFEFAWVDATPTPNGNFAVNTGGGPIVVQNPAIGRYTVTFVGLGGPGGNAQVVAHGIDSARCKVRSWFQSGSDELVNV